MYAIRSYYVMDEFTAPDEARKPESEAEDWSDEIETGVDADALSGDQDLVGRAGLPLQPGMPPVDSDEPIVEALREVHDPEIPVNIYDLGLIYDILRSEDGDVKIFMTLTAPGCPVAGELPTEVAETVARVRGVGVVEVYLVVITSYSIHYTKLYEADRHVARGPVHGPRGFDPSDRRAARRRDAGVRGDRAMPSTTETRITSYNVCYTKLLRLGQHVDQPHLVERLADRDVHRVPMPAHRALVDELAALARLLDAAGDGDRPFQGLNHFRHRNPRRRTGKSITAIHAACRLQDPGARELLQDLRHGRQRHPRGGGEIGGGAQAIAPQQVAEHYDRVVRQLVDLEHRCSPVRPLRRGESQLRIVLTNRTKTVQFLN